MNLEFQGKPYEIKEWSPSNKLGLHICLDTETDYTPSYVVPTLATVQAFDGKTCYLIPLNKLKLFLNKHYEHKFIMHNASFDVCVLEKELQCKLHELYDREAVLDTSVLYRLYHLAVAGFVPRKGYNLAAITKKLLNEQLDKNDEVRCNFMQYRGVSLNTIPPQFTDYMMRDVVATFYCWFELAARVSGHDKYGTLLSHHIQAKGEYALAKIHQNGIGFDLERRDEWLTATKLEMNKRAEILATYGFVRGMKGNKERFLSALEFFGIKDKLPLTEKGAISTTAEALSPYLDNPMVKSYLEYTELEKAASFVENVTSSRLHPRYTSILNTGRTSCSGSKEGACNIQQIPRVGGLREMFVPAKGKVFIDVDYSALELAVLAQVMYSRFGYSSMRDKINEGADLHYYLASKIHGKPEDRISKDERQFAKIGNFGFAANMAATTFIDYCKGYGLNPTEAESQRVKDAFGNAYPETRDFFNVGNATDVYTMTGRKRADCTYTAYLNTQFQGLAADGFKIALYELTKAGYTIVAEIHDQVLIEANSGEEMGNIQQIMENSMRSLIKNVKISTEGQVLERWVK
jgi:DNA polymerase I-like protein with 3'-5' exonuclease and polymerase domains